VPEIYKSNLSGENAKTECIPYSSFFSRFGRPIKEEVSKSLARINREYHAQSPTLTNRDTIQKESTIG
jgi:hypothetical protein